MILELKEIDGKKRTGGAVQIDAPGRTGGVQLTDGATRIDGRVGERQKMKGCYRRFLF
jgi:hypothetical protein